MKDPDPPLINVPKYKDMNINRVQWPDVNQKQVDVVLLTLEDEEFRAAYDTLQNPGTADSGHSLGPVYFSKIGKNNVALLKSSLGAIGIAGVQATCLDAIHHLNPKAIICPGLCFGMNKGKHQLGDVLVSTQIAFYGPTRNNKDGSTNPLGPIVECNARLRKLFDGGKVGWNYHVSEKINPRIHCGQIISGPQIIECCDRKEELKKLYPEALGGEMQGEGE